MSYYINGDLRQVENLSQEIREVVDRAAQLTALALKANIQREAPVDEGLLQGSYRELTPLGPGEYGIGSHVRYRWFVHEGTGIYGPHKQRIYPQKARALRFFWRKAGGVVYFKSVAGQEPNPYIDRAIEGTEPHVGDYVNRALREVLE